MRISRRSIKVLLALSLAVLVAFVAFLQLPQAALSYARYSVTSTFRPQKTPLDANKYQAQNNTIFPDIQGHWAQTYIESLATRDIIAGYPDGNYRPESLVTRAEFAAIINKAFSPSPERSNSDFVDVPVNYWGYEGIKTSYRGGFLQGYPGRVFQPKQHIPRVQVIVALSTGLKLRSEKTELLTYYSDVSEIPKYAAQSVAGATEQQLVVNYPNLTQLNPNREATRAEVAAFVYQALVNAGKANPIASTYVANPSSTGTVATRPTTTPTTTGNTDPDSDGLPDERERTLGTDPNKWDTDGDGLNDGLEVAQGTSPTTPNTSDLSGVDSDNDGLPNKVEESLGTNPRNSDTDSDGITDGTEVAQRTNPNDSNSPGQPGRIGNVPNPNPSPSPTTTPPVTTGVPTIPPVIGDPNIPPLPPGTITTPPVTTTTLPIDPNKPIVAPPSKPPIDPIKNPLPTTNPPTTKPPEPSNQPLGEQLPTRPTDSLGKVKVTIINREQIDGVPLITGQGKTLSAEAKDEKGADISPQIEWVNAEGELLGRGKTLNYDPSKVKNETVRVRVQTPNASEAFDSVSFTISPPGIILAPNVKALKDEAQKNIIDLDFKEPGRVCLINDINLPSIKVGDVILGAGGIIPPVRVLKIASEFQQVDSKQLERLCLTTEFAPLEEVFKETPNIPITPKNPPLKLAYNSNGSKWVDFKPYLDPKTGKANNIKAKPQWPDHVVNCNRNGYRYRFEKRDQLDKKNSGGEYNTKRNFPTPEQIIPDVAQQYYFNIFNEKEASDQTVLEDKNRSGRFTTSDRTVKEYSVDANLYFGYDFQPEVSGDIGFSLDKGLRLKFQGGANETLIAGLDLQAFYKYAKTYKTTLASIEGLEAPRISFSIGPIPVWIDFPLYLDFEWDNNFQFEVKDGVFGLLQTGYFDVGFEYENGFRTTKDSSNLSALMLCGDVDMSGFTEPALLPRVQFLLYSVGGPQIGLKGYVRGDLTRPQRTVSIAQPALNTVVNATAPISLQANVSKGLNIQIKVGSGLNLNGQILAANRLLFPPYKLEIIGRKCVTLGWGKWKKTWCTDPVEVSFDVNKYFKNLTGFDINLAKSKEVTASIPLSTGAFEQLKSVPLEESIVVWQADGTTTLGTSKLKSPATIQASALTPGAHEIKATVYAPLDTEQKQPLGSSSVKISIK